MKPLSICILSHPRSGSTRLIDIMSSHTTWRKGDMLTEHPNFFPEIKKRKGTLSLGEFFRQDRIKNSFATTFKSLNVVKEPKSILTAMEFLKLKKILNEDFGINFLTKVFQNHIPLGFYNSAVDGMPIKEMVESAYLTIEDLIEFNEIVILNYRNNLLETCVSHLMAPKIHHWNVRDDKEKKKYDNKYKKTKIYWNKEGFISYSKRTKKFINTLETELKRSNKKYIKINYEEMSSWENPQNEIQNKLKSIGYEDLSTYDSPCRKLSPLFNSKIFKNEKKFLKDYSEIKEFIYMHPPLHPPRGSSDYKALF